MDTTLLVLNNIYLALLNKDNRSVEENLLFLQVGRTLNRWAKSMEEGFIKAQEPLDE